MLKPIIEVVSGQKRRKMLLTGDDPVTIGRDDSNSVVCTGDDLVSRFHCVIVPDGKAFRLRDLGSSNGTLVNGQRIDDVGLEGDEDIRVGRVHIRFHWEEIDPALVKRIKNRHRSRRAAEPAGPAEEAPTPDLGGEPDGEPPIELAPVAEESPIHPRTAPKLSVAPPEPVSSDSVAAAVDHAKALAKLVASLPDQSVDEGDLKIINARGQKVAMPKVVSARQAVEAGHEGLLFIRAILLLCIRARATDFHLEPKKETCELRVRMDGMMTPLMKMHSEIGQRLIRVVKVICDVDVSQTRTVQEGHFSAKAPGRSVDFRVSFTPAMLGQKLVIRVLDEASAPGTIEDLAMPVWMEDELKQVVHQDSGMILVCGPTGSGKTTTLYTLIRQIDRSVRNVVTIEDPIEYQIDGVTQLPINDEKGNTFANLLKSVLRQDPDVLLVGEIRDTETARIAMQAAMTGHLVLSTVHARDSIGTIFRLLDLGVDPYLVAGGIHIVLGQRLIRRLCPRCRFETMPTALEFSKMNRHGVHDQGAIYRASSCDHCLQTGYVGRSAIFEMLKTTDEMRDAIVSGQQLPELRKALKANLYTTLMAAAYRAVAEGATSLDELERVLGVDQLNT